jgi:glycosyltransferase involved in cell wall biosynthesis
LKAFALVKERYPDAALVVAGYGSQEQLLRDLAASLKVDGIEFLGRVEPEAMPALYDHADIYVNASILDNQPVSLLEAFAAGTPVVSTGVGDISYMITHGETGLIIPQHDPDAMAKAVISLLENPLYAVSIARRAKQEVERFTWPHVRKEWAVAYTGKIA